MTFGEIMMRLVPPNNLRINQSNAFDYSFGGSESNVAISLANFGMPVSFVTALPDNEFGHAAIKDLRMYGVDTSKSIWCGNRIGVYFVEMGTSIRNGQVIYDRDNTAISTIPSGAIDWPIVFKDANWFHWSGITPAISNEAAAICKEAIAAAKTLGMTISCDLNHRQKLWKYGKSPLEVMPDLVKACDVLIAHRDAAEIHLGVSTSTSDDQEFMSQLLKEFPKVSTVVTTLKSNGDNGMTYQGILQDRSKSIRSKVYTTSHFVDRLGGGDAFMGGLIYGLQKLNDQEALEFATAATVLKYSVKGDPNQVSTEEVLKLMKGDGSGRIIR